MSNTGLRERWPVMSSRPRKASRPDRVARRQGGQELVEYALVFPLLLLLILGIIEFGIIIFSYNTISNAAREGARYGVVNRKDMAGVSARVRDRAVGLDQSLLQVTSTETGGAIRVEVIYDARLMTAPIVEAVGGDPTLRLRAVSTMRAE
jgi:Flp pilus assembly protein TadG